MKRFYSIRIKLVFLLVIILISVFSLNAYSFIGRESETLKENLIEDSKSFAALSAGPIIKNYGLYYESGFYKYGEVIEDIMSLNDDLERIQIFDLRGRILFDSKELDEGKYSESASGPRTVNDEKVLERIKKLEFSLDETVFDGKKFIDIVQPQVEEWGRHDYSIRYFISLASLEQNTMEAIYSIIVVNSIFLFVSLAMIFFFSNHFITGPLGKLTKGVEMFGHGKFEQRTEIKSNDEIGKLSSAFDQMVKDLKISHEQIQKHAEELEKRVEERTSDLDEKVKELTNMKTAILNMMEDMDEANKQLVITQGELEKSLAELKETDIKKDQFISIAAHELKTPLTSIHGFSQLLQNRKIADNLAKRNKYLKIMDHETKRLGKLVGDILDLSRIDLGTIKLDISSVDMNETMDNIRREMDIHIKEKRLESEYDIEKNLPLIQTDVEKLTEIVINLINNAVKYTPKGKIWVKVCKEGGNIHFMVKDTGIGIAKENQEKVFDRFYQVDSSYTRNVGGTGLGLSLCQEFIQLLGGKIWLKSELGKGSEFHFTLPISGPGKLADRKARAEETIRMAKKIQQDVKKTGFGPAK